jgi:hypothetical protein
MSLMREVRPNCGASSETSPTWPVALLVVGTEFDEMV